MAGAPLRQLSAGAATATRTARRSTGPPGRATRSPGHATGTAGSPSCATGTAGSPGRATRFAGHPVLATLPFAGVADPGATRDKRSHTGLRARTATGRLHIRHCSSWRPLVVLCPCSSSALPTRPPLSRGHGDHIGAKRSSGCLGPSDAFFCSPQRRRSHGIQRRDPDRALLIIALNRTWMPPAERMPALWSALGPMAVRRRSRRAPTAGIPGCHRRRQRR